MQHTLRFMHEAPCSLDPLIGLCCDMQMLRQNRPCSACLAAQHSPAQPSPAQPSTAQHSTAQHSTAQHSTAQHSTAQHSTAWRGEYTLCSTFTDSTDHISMFTKGPTEKKLHKRRGKTCLCFQHFELEAALLLRCQVTQLAPGCILSSEARHCAVQLGPTQLPRRMCIQSTYCTQS